jgi:hypothetical protein
MGRLDIKTAGLSCTRHHVGGISITASADHVLRDSEHTCDQGRRKLAFFVLQ